METVRAPEAPTACRCTSSSAMLVGADVGADGGWPIEGTLLSCTTRSAWIVVGDVDHVVALPHLQSIHRR